MKGTVSMFPHYYPTRVPVANAIMGIEMTPLIRLLILKTSMPPQIHPWTPRCEMGLV